MAELERREGWSCCLVLWLMGILVEKVVHLAGHGIEDSIVSRLVGHRLHDWLHAMLLLLVVETETGCHGQLLVICRLLTQIHVLKLLSRSGHVDELLLETHLLLSKILVRANQLIVEVGIHLRIILVSNLDGRRSKDLFRRVELVRAIVFVVVLNGIGKVGTHGRPWHGLLWSRLFRAQVSPSVNSEAMIDLGRWSRRGEHG